MVVRLMNEYVVTITLQTEYSYLISASTKEEAIIKAIEFYGEDDEYNLNENIVNISIDIDLNEEE